MKLLLTGAPRVGKSTLLRRLAEAYPGNAGGVVVAGVTGTDGRRSGFDLQVVWSAPGGPLQVVEQAMLARPDLASPLQVGRYGVSLAALALAVRALDAAMHENGLVLVDELGPMQLASDDLRDALLRCLDSPGPLIATLSQGTEPFVEQMRHRPGVRVVEVTRANRLHLAGGLQAWLAAMRPAPGR